MSAWGWTRTVCRTLRRGSPNSGWTASGCSAASAAAGRCPRPDAFVADQDAALTEASAPRSGCRSTLRTGCCRAAVTMRRATWADCSMRFRRLGGGSAALFRGIYLAESAEFPADSACLVLSGRYKSDPNASWNDVETTYYRVDFCRDVRDGGGLAPVLRNHRYLFSVKRVSGPGMPTVEEALKSASVNLEVDVESWNDFPETETADRIVPLHLELKGLDFAGGRLGRLCGRLRIVPAAGRERRREPLSGPAGCRRRVRPRASAAQCGRRRLPGRRRDVRRIAGLRSFRPDERAERPLHRDKPQTLCPAAGRAGQFRSGHGRRIGKGALGHHAVGFLLLVGIPAGVRAFGRAAFMERSAVQRDQPDDRTGGAGKEPSPRSMWGCSPPPRLDVGINYADISVGKDGAGQPAGAPGVTYPFYLRGVYVVNYRSHFSLTPDFRAADELCGRDGEGPLRLRVCRSKPPFRPTCCGIRSPIPPHRPTPD